MTEPAPRTTACPNCGGSIRFLWAQAVQTTCPYCRSVLVRRDLDLERVGEQADFPATGSPIRIGVDGTWRGRGFTVVGRIAYGWARGRWNEWHCRTADGGSAWLSDAGLEYAMTAPAPSSELELRTLDLSPGEWVTLGGRRFEVATRTRARYLGTEGELPFTTWTREECLFIDLQDESGGLATIDTTEQPPTLYIGEYVTFESLALRGVVEFDGWPVPS